jgi:hypothetical protein
MDIYGTEVNIAGRLLKEIKKAEIWLSDSAKTAVQRNGAVQHSTLIWGSPKTIELRGLEPEQLIVWPLLATRDGFATPVAVDRESRTSGINRLNTGHWLQPHRRPHNFEEVEILSRADVVFDQSRPSRAVVLAQLDFIPRFYIRAPHAYVEFELQRAFLTVWSETPGRVSESDVLRLESKGGSASYIPLRDMPEGAISLCIDPEPGQTGLGRSALPPTYGENAEIAVATPETAAALLKAELRVPLNPEGLYLNIAESVRAKVSDVEETHIKAILRVAATRGDKVVRGQIRKRFP